jgi:hypothetical protein
MGRHGEDVDAAVAVAVAAATAAEAWDSGLEDEEGEGSWKSAAYVRHTSHLGNRKIERV